MLKDIHSELILVGSVLAALGSAVTRGGETARPQLQASAPGL